MLNGQARSAEDSVDPFSITDIRKGPMAQGVMGKGISPLSLVGKERGLSVVKLDEKRCVMICRRRSRRAFLAATQADRLLHVAM